MQCFDLLFLYVRVDVRLKGKKKQFLKTFCLLVREDMKAFRREWKLLLFIKKTKAPAYHISTLPIKM